MNPLIQLKQTPSVFLIAFGLAWFGLLPTARAVSPPPDGGYPNQNTAEGFEALFRLTNGFNNTALGYEALLGNTNGADNTATGGLALFSNTTGNSNTATGAFALIDSTTGNNNTATGYQALESNTNGSDNTAVGFAALAGNSSDAIDNTAVGSGALLKNASASFNTAIGFNALFNNTASSNTAVGDQALFNNTSGTENAATGAGALFKNTTGSNNTADGLEALFSNTAGSNNTADGLLALESNTNGHDNIAVGFEALANNKAGSLNTALGSNAGINLTTGSNNIDIGANVVGNAGDANTIRIGKQGTQKATFIAGIFGTAVSGSPVVVASNGKLGVAASSARFKDAIKPMDQLSEAIFSLKPVTFRYKQGLDPDRAPQFGLVAEDVAKVNPDLVVRDDNGQIYTVRYEAVNAMLLNEFLKEHKTVQAQQATITRLEKQVEALTAGLQKVSAAVELNKGAQVADNR